MKVGQLIVIGALGVATAGLAGLDRSASAQSAGERRLPLPLGGPDGRISASYWLAALSPAGKRLTIERLIVVAPDGRVVAELEGDERHVLIPAPLELQLNDRTATLTMVHNHPQNGSLSGADLDQLRKPGVSRVVVVDRDSSVYEATTGPQFDAATFSSSVYPNLQKRVLDWLDLAGRQTGQNMRPAYEQVGHVVALILDRIGVIAYRARLSSVSEITAGEYDGLFESIVAAEVKRLAR